MSWVTQWDGYSHILAALHPPCCLVLWDTRKGTKLWKKTYTESLIAFNFDPFHPTKMACPYSSLIPVLIPVAYPLVNYMWVIYVFQFTVQTAFSLWKILELLQLHPRTVGNFTFHLLVQQPPVPEEVRAICQIKEVLETWLLQFKRKRQERRIASEG